MSKFHYVYTAPTDEERKEIDGIRKQYLVKEAGANKLERLRALDKKVRNGATTYALTAGILACLLFGGGLSAILVSSLWGVGVPLAIVGGVAMGLCYPFYRWILRRGKDKHGEEILRLSDELLNGEK